MPSFTDIDRSIPRPVTADVSPALDTDLSLASDRDSLSATVATEAPSTTVLTALEASERIDFKDASRVLNQLEGLGEGLLRTIERCQLTGRDLNPRQAQRFQDNLLRYQNLTREFEEITGHEIELGMSIHEDPARLRSYVETQHRLARGALADLGEHATTTPTTTPDTMVTPDISWARSESMQILAQGYPEISPLFRSQSRSTTESGYVSELFRSGRYAELGISRAELTPNNGILGSTAGNPEMHVLTVEEQIKIALDPATRQIALDRKLADPLNGRELNPDLRRMENIVNQFGTEAERLQLRQFQDSEQRQYSQVRDSARTEQHQQLEARRSRQEQERRAAWLEEQVSFLERSGRGSDNPARASLLRNPEVRAAYTERVYETSSAGRARAGAEASVRSQRLAEDAESTRASTRFARDLQATWRSLGYDVDMSDQIEQLEIRTAVLTRESQLQGIIADSPGTSASRTAQRELDRLGPILEQIRQNQSQTDPSLEQAIAPESLPSDLQTATSDRLIESNRLTLREFYQGLQNQRGELDRLLALQDRINTPDFEPRSLNLGRFADLAEYQSALEQRIETMQSQQFTNLNGIQENLYSGMSLRDLEASQQNIARALQRKPDDEIIIRMQQALEQELSSRRTQNQPENPFN